MKYMSLEAIYSQPRTATVVCHTLLLKLTSPLLICAPPTLYVSTLTLFCHCHCKLIHNRPWCRLPNLFTSSSLLTGLGSSASWQCPREVDHARSQIALYLKCPVQQVGSTCLCHCSLHDHSALNLAAATADLGPRME